MSTIGYINIALETFGGLLSLIIVICLIAGRQRKAYIKNLFIRTLLFNTIVLFSDALAWIFKGQTDIFSFYIVRIANFSVYFFGYILLAVSTDYLIHFICKDKKKAKFPIKIMWGFTAIAIFLVIISQFNQMYYLIDENNIYRRQEWFWLSQTFGIICMVINGIILIQNRRLLEKREFIAIGIYIMMPMIALFIQIFIYGIAVLYLATTISLLCIYIGIQSEQSQRLSDKELELEKNRTAIMLSQIQPHFLYNSLVAIQQLCVENPEKAENAIGHFAKFLRGNMSSLSSPINIPFSKELMHTQAYLVLEQIRFEDRLKVEYDLQVEAFTIPSLILQPIVENAVRYGITKNEDGGTVHISTKEEENNYIITVRDNGVGFDTKLQRKDDRGHYGLENVRNRLILQCNGSLKIHSVIGSGTTVVISIPKERQVS